MRPSGIRPSLSSEDKEVKRKLVKCSPRTYFELIRSYIPRPFGEKSSRPSEPSGEKSSPPSVVRPSQSSVMKPSREEEKKCQAQGPDCPREQPCGLRQGPEVGGVFLAIIYSRSRVVGEILGKRSHASSSG